MLSLSTVSRMERLLRRFWLVLDADSIELRIWVWLGDELL
jgi:hypothetical protein